MKLKDDLRQKGYSSWSAMIQRTPVYPMRAQESGTQGYVIVAFDINKKGAAENVYKLSLVLLMDKSQINDVFDGNNKRILSIMNAIHQNL